MIRELRRRHLVLAAGLAVAAPLLAAGAMLARASPAVKATLPGLDPVPAGTRLELPAGFPVAVVAARSGDSLQLVSVAPTPLGLADALLYWSPEAPTEGRLPADAVLLGPVGEGRPGSVRLARGSGGGGGHLVLWGNARGEVAAAAAVTLPAEVR